MMTGEQKTQSNSEKGKGKSSSWEKRKAFQKKLRRREPFRKYNSGGEKVCDGGKLGKPPQENQLFK